MPPSIFFEVWQMNVELYDYQKAAVDDLNTGKILQAGVGTGKSITALSYFYDRVCHGDVNHSDPPCEIVDLYIITTARKRDSLEWHQECAAIGLYPGEYNYGINITIDSWNNIKHYIDVKDAFFIFDEQRVVGYGSWTKSFLKITKSNDWILLTATPGDVWMDYLPVFIANGFYKNKTEFIKKHVIYNPHTNYPQVLRYINCGELLKHKSEITVHMKKKVNKKKHYKFKEVGYSEKDYKTIQSDLWNPFKNEPIENASQLCYTLRKLVNSSQMRTEEVGRIQRKHKKCIVFYNYDYELNLLKDYAERKHILYKEWNGHKHEPIPSKAEWLYFVQYTAGAEGWNAIQTNTIIFFSLNYSYKMMIQAAGRIDRLNSPYDDLYYYYLVSKSPIDNRIRKALHNKKDFNQASFVSKGVFKSACN